MTQSDSHPHLAAEIAKELQLRESGVAKALALLEEGNTIPFIARYRKEATGSLDEIALRAIEDAFEAANQLLARRKTILKSMADQGVLTDELRQAIENCNDLRNLEAIYLPFKPKRRTRASIAKEKGLQPLAEILLQQASLDLPKSQLLKRYVDPQKGVANAEEALDGALDIVAETWADQADLRQMLFERAGNFGKIVSKVKRGKKKEAEKFESYWDHEEAVKKIPSHRFLAMARGSQEGLLRIQLKLEDSYAIRELESRLLSNPRFEFSREMKATVEDCYHRLLLPATESAVLQDLKEKSDTDAIQVFGKNLNELLMAAPAGPRVTLGIDPGFRTGCKLAVVDKTGKFLENATIYPTPPKDDNAGAAKTLLQLINQHDVELIAIGNGTASRETDAFVAKIMQQHSLQLTRVTVSESGASIYSASEVAVKEFPDLDITVRGAISIARRLQDPLAELVKTDPKSIGVGQYQHDVNQTRLRKCLERTVESCVNQVGVDLNTASASLLAYVAGIGPGIAERIVEHRNQHGRFSNRKQLTDVPKLGKKAFEQSAGFLRIRSGDQPLDNSAVHPESYPVVDAMARELQCKSADLVGNSSLSSKLSAEEFVTDRFGLPTINDILAELGKPGRDPRSEFRAVRFNENVNSIEELKEGLVLEGVVTNVTHFGAFVDIGVHQDGLIHISQLADRYISDPSEVVSVGDVVKVKVIEFDADRKRISLTRKF